VSHSVVHVPIFNAAEEINIKHVLKLRWF